MFSWSELAGQHDISEQHSVVMLQSVMQLYCLMIRGDVGVLPIARANMQGKIFVTISKSRKS